MANIRDRIEKWFETVARVFYRHCYKTLLAMLLFLAILLSQIPKITIDVSTEGFLHESDPVLMDYNAFRDQFGRDEMIIIAIRSEDVFGEEFLRKLKRLHEELVDNVPFVEDITSLVNARSTRGEADELIVEDLMQNWPETDVQREILRKRVLANPLYQNLLISAAGKFTTIVIKTQTYSSEGVEIDVLEQFDENSGTDSDPSEMPNGESQDVARAYLTDAENSQVVGAINRIVEKYRASDFQIDIAGSCAVTHFLKRSMFKDMRKFMSLALLTIAVFLYIMFRRVTAMVFPLLIVLLSLLSTIAIMAIFKAPIKIPTQILPSFLLAVSVGYSVHILALFYHHFRKHRSKEEAITYAIGHSGLAVLMTAVTTAGGLFSFATSEVAPIADLGRFAGFGVLLAMLYTIILLPALFGIVPLKPTRWDQRAHKTTVTDRLLSAVGNIATKYPYVILIVSAGIIALSGAGLMMVRFSHDVLRWFPKENPVRIATEKIDKELRGSIGLEVVVDTGKENGLYDYDLLKRLDNTTAYLEKVRVDDIFVGKAWSLTTILKETHRALNENREEFYTIPSGRKLIAQELLLFENSGSDDLEDFTDSQFAKARLTLKVPFKDAIGYSQFIDVVRKHLYSIFPDIDITITGMTALLFRTVTNAMAGMKKSYIYALIVITLLMIFLIGRVRIGLLSMVPNLSPIVITLGLIGWFNIPLNLFTMLVGNIAIGLAVDDTIHFMHNFRRYFETHKDAKKAVMQTLHTTGRAMLVTSCVLSIGFFIFMFATMDNLFYFGLLTGFTIIMALLADYFIAPALMVIVNRNKE